LGIVRGHDGTLALHSELRKGSRFTIFLPLLAVAQTRPELHTIEFNLQPNVQGAVLVVDDEETVRDVARRLLEREGIRVLIAEDGEQAVQVYRQYASEITLVLMDLSMPKMDGEQAFHAIRTINPKASIVLSSGFLNTEAVERLQRQGLSGFVKKPYTRSRLLHEVTRLGVADVADSGMPTSLDF